MTDNTDLTEEQIRKIAREEAHDVYDVTVADSDGQEWSLRQLIDQFEISRRTALKALGLITLGVSAPMAVLRAAATPGDDGDTIWGSDSNRDDYYADEIDANLITADDRDVTNIGALVTPSSNQTIPDSTITTVAFDTVEFEDSTVVSFNDSLDTLNTQVEGVYAITATVAFDTTLSQGDQVDLRLVEGGSTVTRDRQAVGGAINPYRSVATVLSGINLNFELEIFQTSGADIDLRSADTQFSIVKIS